MKYSSQWFGFDSFAFKNAGNREYRAHHLFIVTYSLAMDLCPTKDLPAIPLPSEA